MNTMETQRILIFQLQIPEKQLWLHEKNYVHFMDYIHFIAVCKMYEAKCFVS